MHQVPFWMRKNNVIVAWENIRSLSDRRIKGGRSYADTAEFRSGASVHKSYTEKTSVTPAMDESKNEKKANTSPHNLKL